MCLWQVGGESERRRGGRVRRVPHGWQRRPLRVDQRVFGREPGPRECEGGVKLDGLSIRGLNCAQRCRPAHSPPCVSASEIGVVGGEIASVAGPSSALWPA